MILLTPFLAGIAAANTSHVKCLDGDDRRVKYDAFYEQLLRVKDIAYLSFSEHAQQLLVICIRANLEQPRASEWYEGHWTSDYGRYCLSHARYAWSNNNMGIEVDWRDINRLCPPSEFLHNRHVHWHSDHFCL